MDNVLVTIEQTESTFWASAATATLLGLAFVVIIVLPAIALMSPRIRAVTVNTIRQALRMKIAGAFIILLLVLLPVMGVVMTGDGTLKGRLQTFVSYGLSLTSLLLCLMAVVASTYTVTSDIEDKQIYTVLTKPIRRFQLITGKLLGVIILCAGLLVLFSSLIYGIVAVTPHLVKADEAELEQVKNEFFTARAGLKPVQPDLSEEVERVYAEMEKQGELPPSVTDYQKGRQNYKMELGKQMLMELRAAPVGRELAWRFRNVRPADPGGSIFIRYKYDVSENPADLQVYGAWFVGDERSFPYRSVTFERKELIRSFHEIEVPASVVADDGYLAVGFFNPPLNDTVVVFPAEDGVEVLYKADTFLGNYVRGVLLIFFRLIFLASLGMLAASFLSFPVSIMLCLLIFFAGTINGFILDSFTTMGQRAGQIYAYTVKPLISLLPQFDKFNPSDFLVPARLLRWSVVAEAAGLMVGLKSLLLVTLSLVVFSFREIARIIV